jgi:hypothetical protein
MNEKPLEILKIHLSPDWFTLVAFFIKIRKWNSE